MSDLNNLHVMKGTIVLHLGSFTKVSAAIARRAAALGLVAACLAGCSPASIGGASPPSTAIEISRTPADVTHVSPPGIVTDPSRVTAPTASPTAVVPLSDSMEMRFDPGCPQGFDLLGAVRVQGASPVVPTVVSDSDRCLTVAQSASARLGNITVMLAQIEMGPGGLPAKCHDDSIGGLGCLDYDVLMPGAKIGSFTLGSVSATVYLPMPQGDTLISVQLTQSPNASGKELANYVGEASVFALGLASMYLQHVGITPGEVPASLPPPAPESRTESITPSPVTSAPMSLPGIEAVDIVSLACDGRTVVLPHDNIGQVTADRIASDIATEYPGAQAGVFEDDCLDPGKLVIFYGPYDTLNEGWIQRRELGLGRATVNVLDENASLSDRNTIIGGVCQLWYEDGPTPGPGPKLSMDPTDGLQESPWVFELVEVLVEGGYGLGMNQLGSTTMNPEIEAAVKRFQSGNGLEADGYVGDQTWSTIWVHVCGD